MLLNLSKEFDRKKYEAYSSKLLKKEAKVEIKEFRSARTISQNSFLHVCLGYFSIHTGYTKHEAKQEFQEMLPDLFNYKKGDKTYIRSTSDFTKEEMIVLIEFIRSFCLDQLGIYIPDSETYLIEQFAINKELENAR
jgi:hypothetical protein